MRVPALKCLTNYENRYEKARETLLVILKGLELEISV